MKLIPVLLIALAVVGMWLATLFFGLFYIGDWPTRGQFGDLFGSINALFSGLAFAGLIYAIVLQKQELGLQREELGLQRQEMKASREELAKQVAAQEALFAATVGQIRVSAQQGRIEALKIEAERQMPHNRQLSIDKINEAAERMQEIADALRNR